MFRKNIPETITAVWRTLEAFLDRLQIYAVQEPRNLHVGPVSYSLNGAWNNFGPMNKKFPYIVIMLKKYKKNISKVPLILFNSV